MPKISQINPAAFRIKGLHLGASGSGKTGALASLANAGFNLRIVDYDNGLDCLGSFLTPEAADRVIYETFTDKFTVSPAGVSWAGMPTAFSNSMKLLSNWKMPERTINGVLTPAYDLGPISSWTEQDILIIDSLTIMGNAIMRYNLGLQSSSSNFSEERKLHPRQSDWGEAQNRQEAVLEMLYSDQIKCNIIINAHIKRQGGGGTQVIEDKANPGVKQIREVDSEEGKGYPSALGRALPPKIGRYFNNMLYFFTDKYGKRWISTVPKDNIDCKTPAPNKLKPQYPIETGLAEIFRVIRENAQPKTA
jgi:hypothetical protein